MTSPMVDAESLRSGSYADDSKLSKRQAIYRFIEQPWPSSRGRVLDAITLEGHERVVDVGCGNGLDLGALVADGFAGTLIGIDLSPGMLGAVGVDVPLVVGDAARLPLATGSADVVLAMHMLYHCPDIPAAVVEMRRVLRPGGVLVASTNALDGLGELRDVFHRHLTALVGRPVGHRGGAAARFSLDHGGDVLGRSFESVEVRRYDNHLRLPSSQPGIDWLDSTRDFYGDVTDDQWRAGLAATAADVDEAVGRDGSYRVRCDRGSFVCR